MSIAIGFALFLLAALSVRHAAYLLLRGSIFENLRTYTANSAEKYAGLVEPARRNYRNYRHRKHGRGSVRRRIRIFFRMAKYLAIKFASFVIGKVNELFGCYVCMTAQLSIWLIAVPTAIAAFARYRNPVSALFGHHAGIISTVAFTGLGALLLALAVAAVAVVFWHAIDWVETHRSDRLNAESAARQLALSQDSKLQQLTDLVRQLESMVEDLQQTVESMPTPSQPVTVTRPDEKAKRAATEKPAEKPTHSFVRTLSGNRFTFLDAQGIPAGPLINNKQHALIVLNASSLNTVTVAALRKQIDEVFANKSDGPIAQGGGKKSDQFTLQDAEALVASLASCDHITWCGFERRDCRTRKTSEFMAQWARDRRVVLNGLSEKVDQMMADFYHARHRNKQINVVAIYQAHFAN